MYSTLHVQYPLFKSDLNELEFSGQIFQKYSNIKFHENLFGESRVAPCEEGTHRQMYRHDEANKLIIA